MKLTQGSPNVKIGIIDGPIDTTHSDFKNSKFRMVHDSDFEKCRNSNNIACEHGTLVTGIMASKRGSQSASICPKCTFILNPIFSANHKSPSATPEELALAIIETVDAGANLINLSLGISTSSITNFSQLDDAICYAISKGVILITAAGNQGKIGTTPSFNKMNNILVVACDSSGIPANDSNLVGGGINRPFMCIMAPGVDITSAIPNNSYLSVSGTSIAAPIVTGTIALVASIFPNISMFELRRFLVAAHKGNRTIVPPLLNAEGFFNTVYPTS